MKPQSGISCARRVSIVGSTGSGKTYLARELARRLDLPLHELDRLRQHSPGTPSNPDFVAAVAELVETDSWIIDGHYRDVRQTIWDRCDTIVHLDYPAMLVIMRLLGRFLGKRRDRRRAAPHGGTPPIGEDLQPADPATWPRRIRRLGKTIRERSEYARIFDGPTFRDHTVIALKSPRAARQWLDSVASQADAGAARLAR